MTWNRNCALAISLLSCVAFLCWNQPTLRNKRALVCQNNGTYHARLGICVCNFMWTGPLCSVWRYHECYFDKGFQYRGRLSITRSGSRCSPWTTDSNNNLHPLGVNGIDFHNFCRNPDNDEQGLWCYVDGEQFVDYCNASVCPESYKSPPNITAPEDADEDEKKTVRFLFGPLISGVCGGVVALLLLIAIAEYLRRRGLLCKKKKLRSKSSVIGGHTVTTKTNPGSYAPESVATKPLGGVVTVNVDTGKHTRQSGRFKPKPSSLRSKDSRADNKSTCGRANGLKDGTGETPQAKPTRPVPKPRTGVKSSRAKEQNGSEQLDGKSGGSWSSAGSSTGSRRERIIPPASDVTTRCDVKPQNSDKQIVAKKRHHSKTNPAYTKDEVQWC